MVKRSGQRPPLARIVIARKQREPQERRRHMQSTKVLFPLGQIVATPGALDALTRAKQSPHDFLNRHGTGDWGELGNEDKTENEYSLQHGFRILSSYTTAAGEKPCCRLYSFSVLSS